MIQPHAAGETAGSHATGAAAARTHATGAAAAAGAAAGGGRS